VIKLCDLNGSFLAILVSQREKWWWEFFLDPLQWWDHKLEKVIGHQSYWHSHDRGFIALVDVNIATLSLLLSYHSLIFGIVVVD
jgi:hypothetical protein